MKITIDNKESGNVLFYPFDEKTGTLPDYINIKYKNESKHLKSKFSQKRFYLNNNDITVIKISDKNTKIDYETIRRYTSIVNSFCKREILDKINIYLFPQEWQLDEIETLNAAIEGFLLTDYEYNKFRSKDNDSFTVKEVCFVLKKQIDIKTSNSIIKKNQLIAESVFFTRDLVNGPANLVNIGYLEKTSKDLAKKNKLKIKVFNKNELKQKGFNLLLAVGSGSKEDPKLIELSYSAGKSFPHICLVGKGIIFDSGGLNLKPGDSMFEMKCDMAGAATVLGIIKAASELKLKINVTVIIPLAENSVGSDSYRPGDIITAYNKKSVVIKNTDAEGRLILADALSYSDSKKSELVMDFATLTGAAVVALGRKISAGYFRMNDNKLKDKFFEAALKKGESVWEMPLYEDYKEMLKDDIAALGNIGHPPREGGSIIGALFLNEFVKNENWAHIDIAGPAFIDSGFYYNTKGGTGALIRTMTDFFENFHRK